MNDTGNLMRWKGPGPLTTEHWMTHLLDDYGRVNKVRTCPAPPEENPWRQRSRVQAGFGTANQAWNWTWGHNYQGSYAINGWFYWADHPIRTHDPKKEFRSESAITAASRTPIFADSVWIFAAPSATDLPSRDLFEGGGPSGGASGGMQRLTIARHGSANPKNASRDHPPVAALPGSINIEFYDGHAEIVRLEDLWSLSWHKGYVAPPSRPR